MKLNPQDGCATYSIKRLADVERALTEIERESLENDEVSGDAARNICSELSLIRDALCLKQGVRRHKKWAPELQNKDT